MNDTLIHCAAAFTAAVAAGAINSVAGGGTLISFSTLLWTGMDSKIANATNTMGLWPASLTGAWGFRKHKPPPGKLLLYFALVSLAGGSVGAVLLLLTPTEQFDAIIPWLVLMAALLFVFQERIARRFVPPAPELPPGVEPPEPGTSVKALGFQFLVGIYGGYFGAGIGIMMLAALGMLQLGDIYRLNYLKNVGALLINLIAALIFGLQKGMIDWPIALSMMTGGIVGALVMSGVARKIGPKALRAVVSTVGFSIAAVMLYRQLC